MGWLKDNFKEENLLVQFNEELKDTFSESLLREIESYLKLDPRPSFQDDDRVYINKYHQYDIYWRVKNNIVTVEEIKLLD